MKPNTLHQKCGIYCIRNLINNKVYIGKSKNIYKRISQHLYDLKNNRKTENRYLQRSVNKYGISNFEYFVLEFLKEDEFLVAKRELFWMKNYNSLNRKFGYNLRSDSDSKMIVHEETRKLISERMKKEWKEGKRLDHKEKLSKSWSKDTERKRNQSILLSQTLTKYKYDVDGEIILYKELKERKLANVMAEFSKKKTNEVNFKGCKIKRLLVEDIVQH